MLCYGGAFLMTLSAWTVLAWHSYYPAFDTIPWIVFAAVAALLAIMFAGYMLILWKFGRAAWSK